LTEHAFSLIPRRFGKKPLFSILLGIFMLVGINHLIHSIVVFIVEGNGGNYED
jgi:hypothetical protein